MSLHRNVYDLLNIHPDWSRDAELMIVEHERKHGPLPKALREWYSVKDVVSLLDKPRLRSAIWLEYSNADDPCSLANVLNQIGEKRLDGRFICIMNECQNVGDWRLELNGSDDPPVWSFDDSHHDEGEEYLLAAHTFSEFLWKWFAEFHQFYKSNPLPNQAWCQGHWSAGNLAETSSSLFDALSKKLGKPQITDVGFGDRRYTFSTTGGIIRLTTVDGNPFVQSALWMYATERSTYQKLTDLLGSLDVGVESLNSSEDDFELARNSWENFESQNGKKALNCRGAIAEKVLGTTEIDSDSSEAEPTDRCPPSGNGAESTEPANSIKCEKCDTVFKHPNPNQRLCLECFREQRLARQ